MALWHILVRNLRGAWVPEGDAWDDGEQSRPGEAGFLTQDIQAQAADKRFNYLGTPNWKVV